MKELHGNKLEIQKTDTLDTFNINNCNCRRSIGYCPYAWKFPLQRFQPAPQGLWLWDNCSTVLVNNYCTCVTSSDFAGNDVLVAVETSIDVGQNPMDLI